jgi:hypothetical protein
MISLVIPALFAAAAPAPFSPAQKESLRCVAALAIIASDQQKGGSNWPSFPPLSRRGAHFAEKIGTQMVTQTGRTKEQVRAAILAEVAALQAKPGNSATTALGLSCVALMNELDPPPPPPERLYCAALASSTYDAVRAAEGSSTQAQSLGNISAILIASARDELIAGGKSGPEADIVIAEARAKLTRDSEALRQAGKSETLDLEPCLELVQPPEK